MKILPFLTLGLFTAAVPMMLSATESPSKYQLGASRPATADLSTSPDWHVYKFQRDGVTYLQVNDLNDQPRFAVAVANGASLVLPIGQDADRVQVQARSSGQNMTTACGCAHQIQQVAISKNPNIQISTTPSDNGDTWQVQSTN